MIYTCWFEKSQHTPFAAELKPSADPIENYKEASCMPNRRIRSLCRSGFSRHATIAIIFYTRRAAMVGDFILRLLTEKPPLNS
jgi:hypothetical protein